MLSKQNRVRTSSTFSHTVRSGARSGRRNLVLYARCTTDTEPSRFGFIVSRNVGNAVTRNLVKRRLREAAASALVSQPRGIDFVVRALPHSASVGWSELCGDFERALKTTVGQVVRSHVKAGKESSIV
ncbi:ribonuclease P protein component [Arthrobacter sp. H5]|uniref:ribonuclease P protein component n=1 Tax=Arthrobacter sp. H5 TaxID=1267973 RepID=UPI0009DFB432|nr:ribonuclease P protein component [Arthrobacter sp. H5]